MMNERFSLFYAGYTAYAPALYYNKVSLADNYQADEDEVIRECMCRFGDSLKDYSDEYNSYLQTAIGLARHFELNTLPEPTSHNDYFNWLNHYIETFEKQFPMSRIDHYYFLYSRKISEILCNMGLLRCYISLSLELNSRLDLRFKMEKAVKDTEFILFKMIASAALLSSEPRHNFFNVFYKNISSEFEPFRNIDVKNMTEPELKDLSQKVDVYENTVKDGFKKCVGLLKELQV